MFVKNCCGEMDQDRKFGDSIFGGKAFGKSFFGELTGSENSGIVFSGERHSGIGIRGNGRERCKGLHAALLSIVG